MSTAATAGSDTVGAGNDVGCENCLMMCSKVVCRVDEIVLISYA